MNHCMTVMALSAAGAWIGMILAFASNNPMWLFMSVAMFIIAHIADRIDDHLKARARRFE